MDLITRDIQCLYYINGRTPFGHWSPPDSANPPSSWGANRNELLAFISSTNVTANNECTTAISEIKYQKYYATNHSDPLDGWLRRSVTGNKMSDGSSNPLWNYYDNFIVGFQTTDIGGTDTPVASLTVNSSSSDDFHRVIPYVTDLSFTCFNDSLSSDSIIAPDSGTSTIADSGVVTDFPFSIEVNLSLMDKNTWQKWVELGGNVNPVNDSDAAKAYRRKYERTFSKLILIGNRGQYD